MAVISGYLRVSSASQWSPYYSQHGADCLGLSRYLIDASPELFPSAFGRLPGPRLVCRPALPDAGATGNTLESGAAYGDTGSIR